VVRSGGSALEAKRPLPLVAPLFCKNTLISRETAIGSPWHRRQWLTFAFTPEIGYTLGSLRKIARSGLHAETQGSVLVSAWSILLPSHTLAKNSQRKRMHACSVCPLPPAP